MSPEVVFALFIIITSSNLIEPSCSQNTSEVIVEAGVLGQIQGKISTTIGKSPRLYAQFLGIPYAKNTRFMPSELLQEPLNNAGSPFNATQFGPECPQPQTTGSENCLFLNIFSPQIDQSTAAKYPILVFVHGAAFVSGNANMYDGARLLNKDIILITFNYRLGVFGSYNLETQTAPGNAALYDVLTVLNWVKIFAQYFGGDPSQVTLSGQSSGAATVSHMVMSPLSKGLFHRAIASSGSAIDIWATSANPLSASLQVAVYAGCLNPENISPNKTEVMTCMLNKTLAELIIAQNTFQFLEMKSGGSIGFDAITPSVQRFTFPEIETIVPQHPKLVLESGNQNNVSLMMGATRDDGGFAVRLVREGYILANDLINDTSFMRDLLVPTIFRAIGISDPANTIANTFKDIYVEEEAGQSGNFSHMVPSLIDMLGVLFFKSASYQSVQHHSKITTDTYFYSFDYEGQYTRHPDNGGFPGGVAHADDLQYLFQLTDALNEKEQELSDIMVDYWTNFVYTGNPNKYPNGSTGTVPTWPEFETLTNEYLVINNAEIKQASNYPANWVIANKEEILVCQNRSDSNMFNPVLIIFQLLLILTYAATVLY